MSATAANDYLWPREDLRDHPAWATEPDGRFRVRDLPESPDELRADSRWPAFFPSPLCLVTATDGRATALEKVVGASIVNRFPYVMALSFCREGLSGRHYARSAFMTVLERGGRAAVQFLEPGPDLARAMHVITASAADTTAQRLAATDLPVRPAVTSDCPTFEAAYLVYEAALVRPSRDFDGQPIFDQPWLDVGSHRVYFLEINAIQLRLDIARGRSRIRWHSLPKWRPAGPAARLAGRPGALDGVAYQKGFRADYSFPAEDTVGFEADGVEHGRAIKHLPPLAADQVEVDNDRARWPCFFPSSVGMITCAAAGATNLMPCGSTTVLSRSPLIIAPAVSYGKINQRYAPRASLDLIRRAGRFGCGVPVPTDQVLAAIRYAGNVSFALDRDKIANAGLTVDTVSPTPRLAELPIHYDCDLVGEVRLGTHCLFLGEVRRISVRADVTPADPVRWNPWSSVEPAPAKEKCA